MALEAAAAAAKAMTAAKASYDAIAAAAKRSMELTPDESKQLDAEAEKIFASPASQLSGR